MRWVKIYGPAAVAVMITFADHGRETVGMQLAKPASFRSWRLQIGTMIHSGDSGGPPTKP